MDNVLDFAPARLQSRAQLTASWLENGSLEIYTAPRPEQNGGAITTQIKLLSISLDAVSATNGVIVADVGTGIAAMGIVSDTAAWGRALDSNGVVVGDCHVGDANSVALAKLDSLSIVAGSLTTLTEFALAEG